MKPKKYTLAVVALLIVSGTSFGSSAQAGNRLFSRMSDPRGEFIRLCAPYMIKRSAHPEAVCDCLHSQAAATIDDVDVRDALLYGISETGVPTIDRSWLPAAKEFEIDATMTRMAQPTMTCIYGR
jgi:hypothetical protein